MNIYITQNHAEQFTFTDIESGRTSILFVKNRESRTIRVVPDALGIKRLVQEVASDTMWSQLLDLIFPLYDRLVHEGLTQHTFGHLDPSTMVNVSTHRSDHLRFGFPLEEHYLDALEIHCGDIAPWEDSYTPARRLLYNAPWNLLCHYLIQQIPADRKGLNTLFEDDGIEFMVPLSSLLNLAALQEHVSLISLQAALHDTGNTAEIGLHL